jgi:hypothetical protein
MALPAIDAFTATNGDPLSANWTVLQGGWTTYSNYVYGTDGGWNFAYWDADTFADDQYAQCDHINFAGVYSGPALRVAATRGYIALVEPASTSITLRRVNSAGDVTTLQTIGSLTVVSGDQIRLEAEGSTLRVYLNGAQIGTDQTDATFSSGSAGIVSYGSNAGVDDFEGGNLGGGGNRRRRLLLCGR